jgi:hypothetical protein
MCVYKDFDENGDSRLIINDPHPDSRAVAEVVGNLFMERPEDLSNDFQRCAMLVRIAIFLLAATSEDRLRNEMRDLGTRFNKFYQMFCCELQGLMTCSFEMFEMFKTACYYYDEDDIEHGAEMLVEMQGRSETGQQNLQRISLDLQSIQTDVESLIARLETRREELGNYEVYTNCLSECASGILNIHSFLAEQKNFLETLKAAFNFEGHDCARIQVRLNGTTFRRLTSDQTPGGFLYEIHQTILRYSIREHDGQYYKLFKD